MNPHDAAADGGALEPYRVAFLVEGSGLRGAGTRAAREQRSGEQDE
jgi:hypothetical protein